MSAPIEKATARPRDIQAEVRQIREAARKIVASKQTAIRFLASTGMHTAKGRLKPQFN